MFSRFLAKQLSRPSTIMGPLILAPMWNRRNKALNDMVLGLLALQADDLVLEVGFGGGYLLGQLVSAVTNGLVAGIDVSAAMLNFCEKRYISFQQAHRLEMHCASANAIPYEDSHFTKVCSVNSVFYWPDAAQGIGECWRVLCEGGTLVLCFTSKASLGERNFAQHGLHLYDGEEVEQMMKMAGFVETHIERGQDRHRTFWCVAGIKR